MDSFDFFISHASADKPAFVRALAGALMDRGHSVWYDELSIKPGESIRRSIDAGIAGSRAGIVVLSRAFFDRPWPQTELDALLSLHVGQKKGIIPIWLELEYEDVAAVSPIMADRKAVKAPAAMEEIIREIESAFPVPHIADQQIHSTLSMYTEDSPVHQEFVVHRCVSRLCSVAQVGNLYWGPSGPDDESSHDDDEHEVEVRVQGWWAETLDRYEIPRNVYFAEPQTVSDETLKWAKHGIESWARGLLTWRDAAELYFWLDESIDADYLFIFFGIPLARTSLQQRARLHQAIIDVGTRNSGEESVAFGIASKYAREEWYESMERARRGA